VFVRLVTSAIFLSVASKRTQLPCLTDYFVCARFQVQHGLHWVSAGREKGRACAAAWCWRVGRAGYVRYKKLSLVCKLSHCTTSLHSVVVQKLELPAGRHCEMCTLTTRWASFIERNCVCVFLSVCARVCFCMCVPLLIHLSLFVWVCLCKPLAVLESTTRQRDLNADLYPGTLLQTGMAAPGEAAHGDGSAAWAGRQWRGMAQYIWALKNKKWQQNWLHKMRFW